jgi:hypothetical protein
MCIVTIDLLFSLYPVCTSDNSFFFKSVGFDGGQKIVNVNDGKYADTAFSVVSIADFHYKPHSFSCFSRCRFVLRFFFAKDCVNFCFYSMCKGITSWP